MSEITKDNCMFKREGKKIIVERNIVEEFDVDEVNRNYKELECKIDNTTKLLDGLRKTYNLWKSAERHVRDIEAELKKETDAFVNDHPIEDK